MPALPDQQKFGVHVSVAGGLHHAFEAAHAVGCDCLQIFVRNQRRWHSPPLGEDLGLNGFRNLLNDPRLRTVVRILETPKGRSPDGRDWDAVNLQKLRRLVRRSKGGGPAGVGGRRRAATR